MYHPVVIFVVIGDGTGSFKTVNLEVFKLKKEKLFFLISITWYTDTLIPEVSYEPDFYLHAYLCHKGTRAPVYR